MLIYEPGFLHLTLVGIKAADMIGLQYGPSAKTPVPYRNFCKMNNNHPNHGSMTESYGMNTDVHFLYTPENS